MRKKIIVQWEKGFHKWYTKLSNNKYNTVKKLDKYPEEHLTIIIQKINKIYTHMSNGMV